MARPYPRPLPPPWDRIFPLVTRTFVWALLFGIIYLLRSFFLLIFLTFVFAYVQAHGVDGLAHRIKHRVTRVVFVTLVFLSCLVAVGYWMVPKIEQEALKVYANRAVYMASIGREIDTLRTEWPAVKNALPEVDPAHPEKAGEKLVLQIVGLGEPTSEAKENVNATFERLRNVGTQVFAIGSAFLLSLLFSFLIVLDLPRLSVLVNKLEHTKLRFIFVEVAANIREFGAMLGRSLEAQLMIAILNTVLTAIGIVVMGLPQVALLSAIVFFFSFVPVAGVFISSVPICLIALNEGGFKMVVIAIVLITAIHMVETYILNPRIYGHHLRVNPVLVLIVLTIGGTLFHVWGLVLGLPIVTYFFKHAIQFRREGQDSPVEPPPAGTLV